VLKEQLKQSYNQTPGALPDRPETSENHPIRIHSVEKEIEKVRSKDRRAIPRGEKKAWSVSKVIGKIVSKRVS